MFILSPPPIQTLILMFSLQSVGFIHGAVTNKLVLSYPLLDIRLIGLSATRDLNHQRIAFYTLWDFYLNYFLDEGGGGYCDIVMGFLKSFLKRAS